MKKEEESWNKDKDFYDESEIEQNLTQTQHKITNSQPNHKKVLFP
jgi:hypothetical protein